MQGEGINAGTPSVFLRTYFCNLNCTWCDTKYTWQGQEKSKAGTDYELMTTKSVLEKIMSFKCDHLVLTGGEPLLHQRVISSLLSRLKKVGFYVEVETNGTIEPSPEMLDLVDCFNVSPKTSNSLVPSKIRTRPRALKTLAGSRKAWFKFVIQSPSDLNETENLIAEFGVPRDRVILMPEGIETPVLLERSRWLVDVCKEKGFRFTPRLHILLFGNKRGI